MPIIKTFIFISVLFILGGIAYFRIVRKYSAQERKNRTTKYFVYLFLVYATSLLIIFFYHGFIALCILISIIGFWEISYTGINSKIKKLKVISFLSLYILIASDFLIFVFLKQTQMLYWFVYVACFDAFGQVAGQYGKIKFLKKISPNKTLEGLFGSVLFSLIYMLIIYTDLQFSILFAVILSLTISSSAFVGDILASYVKRLYKIKDYSNLIPGHGGILDRYDSLMFSGFVLFIFFQIYK